MGVKKSVCIDTHPLYSYTPNVSVSKTRNKPPKRSIRVAVAEFVGVGAEILVAESVVADSVVGELVVGELVVVGNSVVGDSVVGRSALHSFVQQHSGQ